MSDANHCPQCGAPLAAGALAGLCPACLLKAGAETENPGGGPRFEPPPVDKIKHLFPQLEILGLLGRGGMGAVYQARQPALDRLVALKVLPVEAGGKGFAERFHREARALARLSHPNIVTVHDFGQADGLFFFIMEFVDGLNLRQLEQAGKLSPREALQIVPQICEALQYAHDQGVVHRDIKPENILIDKRGKVKIADFGIAKIVGRVPDQPALTETQGAMGTPHYMAPEQVERPQSVDHRADIFSLGVVFYEMLTGELPLGRFAPPSRKVQVDVRLDEVVLRALEKEPDLRYQQVRQVKTDVETISAAAPATVVSPQTKGSMKKSSLVANVVAAVCLAVAGVFLIGNFIWTKSRQGAAAGQGQTARSADAPQIVSITPAKSATDVDPDTVKEIRVEFDRPMLDGSWSMVGGGAQFPEFAGDCSYDVSRKIWTVPVKLKPGWKYEFGLNSQNHQNFKSAEGVSLQPIWITFQTAGTSTALADMTPHIVSMTPANGATGVSSGTTEIRVVFDRPMQDGSWSMTGSGPNFPELTGDLHYDANRTTFIAPVKLKPTWRYSFGLNSPSHRNFRSDQGVALEPVRVTFTTGQ